jgi:hypothetical protein
MAHRDWYKCRKCGHEWQTRKKRGEPPSCPRCNKKDIYNQTEKKRKRKRRRKRRRRRRRKERWEEIRNKFLGLFESYEESINTVGDLFRNSNKFRHIIMWSFALPTLYLGLYMYVRQGFYTIGIFIAGIIFNPFLLNGISRLLDIDYLKGLLFQLIAVCAIILIFLMLAPLDYDTSNYELTKDDFGIPEESEWVYGDSADLYLSKSINQDNLTVENRVFVFNNPARKIYEWTEYKGILAHPALSKYDYQNISRNQTQAYIGIKNSGRFDLVSVIFNKEKVVSTLILKQGSHNEENRERAKKNIKQSISNYTNRTGLSYNKTQFNSLELR